MPDCPHGDGAHWPGDAGDVVDSLAPRGRRTARTPIVIHGPLFTPDVETWLRTLGAIR